MTDVSPSTQDGQVFRAVLHPHRSLSPTGFRLIMGFIALVSFLVGLGFYMSGAWPVLGFYGLDVLAIYIAFKANYRSGTAYELVELSPQVLTITQVKPTGRRTSFDFNPYWVRVLLNEWPDGSAVLKITSHGREFEFARFLNPEEKRDFAKALQGALARARMGPMPA
jgi:uncharacterized membrane protein